MGEVKVKGKEIYDKLQFEMKEFFKNTKPQNILVQWQCGTELRLEEVKTEHEVNALKQCELTIKAKQSRAHADTLKQSSIEGLYRLVKELVSNLQKGELNEEKLREIYEQEWIKWMTQLRLSNQMDQGRPDIEGSLENCLREMFLADRHVLIQRLTEKPLRQRKKKKLEFKVIAGSHITARRTLYSYWTETNVRADHVEMAEEETHNFLKIAKKYLDGKHRDNENFNPAFCSQLLRPLFDSVAKAQVQYEEFNFTAQYKVDIALTVCGHALFVFEEWQKSSN